MLVQFGKSFMCLANKDHEHEWKKFFVVVKFKHYIGPPWDENNQKYVPITPLSRGQHR